MKKRIISFSIWGDNTRYIKEALENIDCAKEIYPDWVCRFYVRDDVNKEGVQRLKKENCEIIEIPPPYKGDWEGLFWRFYPIIDKEIDRFISRDIDSRVNWREKAAVDEWILSGLPFHIMRDNKAHDVPILGGMWGATGGAIPDFLYSLNNMWILFNEKGVDQEFLMHHIWPKIKEVSLVHDSIGFEHFKTRLTKPFPSHLPLPKDCPYVGAITYDARELLMIRGNL